MMISNEEVKKLAGIYSKDISDRKAKIRDLEWEVRELQTEFVNKLVESHSVELLLPDWTRIRRICGR